MRPHDRHARSRSRGRAAARRILHTSLGWLRGAPVGGPTDGSLPWLVVPEPGSPGAIEEVRVDRETIRRATHAATRLADRFPHAMRRLVGDRRAWHANVRRLLETLQAAVHDGRSLPPASGWLEAVGAPPTTRSRWSDVHQLAPALRPLLDALAWVQGTDTRALDASLAWIETERRRLEAVARASQGLAGLGLQLDLCQLAVEDGGGRVAPFVEGLEHLDAHRSDGPESPGEDPDPDGQHGLRRPRLEFPRAVERLVGKVRRRSPRVRRAAAELLARVSPREIPEHLRDGRILRAVWTLATTWSRRRVSQAIAALDAAPVASGGRLVRCELLGSWSDATEFRGPEAQRRLEPLLVGIRRILAEGACAGRIVEILLHTSWDLTSDVARGDVPRSEIPEVVRAIESVVRAGPTPDDTSRWPEGWTSMRSLLRASGSGRAAGRWLAELVREAGGDLWDWYEEASCRVAWTVAGGDPPLAARLLRRLEEFYIDGVEATDLLALADALDSPRILGPLLLRGDLRRVLETAARATALASLEPSRPRRLLRTLPRRTARSPAPGWISAYPEPLRADLVRLDEIAEDASRRARRLLGRDVPDPGRLRREIVAIEKRVVRRRGREAKGLRLRLHRLRSRLRSPAAPSEGRLANLRSRIARTVEAERLRAWDEILLRELGRALRERCGLPAAEAWLRSPPRRKVLISVLRLREPFRTLGLRLLAARQGPPPWDLRDEPPNRAFIDRLRERGIDPEPWVEGIDPLRATTTNGRSVELALEDDPLEALRMGEPFRTCLAPGAFNFFSAVANAVDVNKRVVYERDATGSVRGRCLLALTRGGEILTFHPYTHDPKEGFPGRLSDFVRELADRMGTMCAISGDVEALVADDWYDDGPDDVTGRYALLREGSSFLDHLASARPDEVPELLRTELAPHPVDAHVLRILVHSAPLEARPELARALPGLVARTRGLQLWETLQLAKLLDRSGDRGAARRALEPLVRRAARRGVRADGLNGSTELAERLLELDDAPAALRVLRWTRERGVRRWEDESRPRSLLAARALEAAQRPRRALRVYLADRARNGGSQETSDRIEALRSRLGPG